MSWVRTSWANRTSQARSFVPTPLLDGAAVFEHDGSVNGAYGVSGCAMSVVGLTAGGDDRGGEVLFAFRVQVGHRPDEYQDRCAREQRRR